MLKQNQTVAATARKHGMSRTSFLIGAALWMAVLIGGLILWKLRPSANANPAARPRPGTSQADETEESVTDDGTVTAQSTIKIDFPARKLPDFEFDEVMGGKLSRKDLEGQRWVASFVFSRCTTSCPMISAAVMKVHERVEKAAPDVKFVSFTVDPKYDTVEVFRQYSEIFTRGNHERWKFVTGGQQEIYELVVKGFGLYVKENLGKTRLPGLEVAHSNRVVLVNEDGIPVGTYLGNKPAEMTKLERILMGRDEFPQPSSGLSISSPDGTPLNVQFELQPAEPDEAAAESDASEDEADARPSSGEEPAPTNESDQDDSADDTASSADESADPLRHNDAIDRKLPGWAKALPGYNAALNSLAAVLLMSGWVAIRNGKKATHRNLMITAFVTSAAFLCCYLLYHYALGKYTGEHGKRFSGDGVAAVVYQLILWPHIVLAVFVPILAIQVFRHAFAERWDAHRALARITFPIWMFVSVTGVVIYGMLYHWP